MNRYYYRIYPERAGIPSKPLLVLHGFSLFSMCRPQTFVYKTKYAFDIFAVIIVKQLMLNS